MKKQIICILVISTVLSCGRRFENLDISSEYTIKNESAHQVKLKVFDGYFDYQFKDTTFLLLPNSLIEFEYINYVDLPFGGAVDSAYIIFDNIRQLIYRKGDGQQRNILDINSYSGGLVNKEWYKYGYNITNEDYDNAKVIK